jgi:quinol monooxygenase YgiN
LSVCLCIACACFSIGEYSCQVHHTLSDFIPILICDTAQQNRRLSKASKTSKSDSIISNTGTFEINDGRIEDAKKVFADLVASTEGVTGTLVFEWFVNEEGTRAITYQRFADNEAFAAYFANADHLAAADVLVPKEITLMGPVDDANKASLFAFFPVRGVYPTLLATV